MVITQKKQKRSICKKRRNWYLCAAAMENTMVIFQKIKKKKNYHRYRNTGCGYIPKRNEGQ